MGYSINDPNIRSLLNDVIEENGGKVGLQIYWVTRDKLKNLDKHYYEEHFKLKIIEEVNIVDFFKKLENRVEKNLELREVVNEEIAEYSKAYLKNYEDESFIDDVLKQGKVNDVLQYLYNQLIEEESRRALRPYFTLLKICERKIINKIKPSIRNILEMQNRLIFEFYDFVNCDVEMVKFLKENNLVNIANESLISFAKGNHAFGGYADSIYYLLLAYSIFKEEIKADIDNYISALASNISRSCSDSPKYLGYDWRGLGVVKKNIKILDKQDLRLLLEELSSDYLSEQRILQLKYVIMNGNITEEFKSKLVYKMIYRKQFKSSINGIIRRVMRSKLRKKYGFEKSENGTYVLNDIELALDEESFDNDAKIAVKNLVSEEDVIKIYLKFIDNKIQVSTNEKIKSYKNYTKFDECEDDFENQINDIFDAYLGEKLC